MNFSVRATTTIADCSIIYRIILILLWLFLHRHACCPLLEAMRIFSIKHQRIVVLHEIQRRLLTTLGAELAVVNELSANLYSLQLSTDQRRKSLGMYRRRTSKMGDTFLMTQLAPLPPRTRAVSKIRGAPTRCRGGGGRHRPRDHGGLRAVLRPKV